MVGSIYRLQGFEVSDIIENMYRNIIEISKKLNIDDKLLEEYLNL